MREGMLLGVSVTVGCDCTWDDTDVGGEAWHARGRWCVGEAWATVRVGGWRVGDYGYGTVGEAGDVVWAGPHDVETGAPRRLMRALGLPHPDRRARPLHGAALRSATRRWERLAERMHHELVDLLPDEVDVPEPDDKDDEGEPVEDELYA